MTAEPTQNAVLLQRRDDRAVVTLTLNDPARFNALGDAMLAALQAALSAIAQDDAVRAVVLAANGRAFCAGHNLKDMAAHTEQSWHQDLFNRCTQVMLAIQKLPVPVIARVHGMATAAGCQLVAQCDLAVASSEAQFATSRINCGLFCATPSVPLVRNMSIKPAMEMLLTGDFIDANQAKAQGLVNRVAAPDQLDAELESLLAAIVRKPRTAVRMGKALVYQQRELGIEAAYQVASQCMACNMMDADAQEGAQAFADKRKPVWAQD